MTTGHQITTAQQLLELENSQPCELVRGELIMMSPGGFEHGRVVARISVRLAAFVENQSLGVVTGAETGFTIGRDPDTVRAPDVGFVGTARLPAEMITGFFPGAPDLAIEVLSPNDRTSEVNAKVQQWLAAGCHTVWLVDPTARTVTRYTGAGTEVHNTSAEMDGGDVLPGFRLQVAEIFASVP